jgi:hypothetical protein
MARKCEFFRIVAASVLSRNYMFNMESNDLTQTLVHC